MPAASRNSQPEAVKLPKSQYHHCIPRFILRQFMTEVQPTQNKRERRLSFRKAHRRKEEHEPIFFYEISTGVLQYRSLSKVYGEKNLYRDLNDPIDVDHLETKLAQLEQEASSVIHQIRKGIPSRRFTLLRKDLSTLRKFIFLMHYRNSSVSSTYFQESIPQNAPLADWIRKYKTTHNLKTDFDVWLDGMKYYLSHSHHEMVAAGEQLRERYGEHRLYQMLRRRLDPDIEESWYAIDYESLANYFFLGVWEAADEMEFVLGGNGFGLWEGLIYGTPGAHRLYVVSPRLAIVLRRTFLRHPHSNHPSILCSSLANIGIRPPIIEHADPSAFVNLDQDSDDMAILRNVYDAYRCSKTAQEDKFTFSITKLDREQTYAVNEVIMMNANLHPTGSLTFASPTAMLKTLKAYMSSHNTFLGGKRSLFRPLLHELTRTSGEESPTAITSLDKPWDVDTDADIQLHTFLRFVVTNGVSFPSLYNRAYLIFHMATDIPSLANPVSAKVRSMQRHAIERLQECLDPPLPVFSSPPKYSLVESVPKDESELFFALLGHQVDQLQVGRHSNDMLANIIYEASMIGVAHWLVKNRSDVLFDLVGFWARIVVYQ